MDRGHELVGANTGGFEGLGGQLFVLVRDQVDTGREVVDVGLLAAKIEDTDLRVGHTTVEARLGVRLTVQNSRLVNLQQIPPSQKFSDKKIRHCEPLAHIAGRTRSGCCSSMRFPQARRRRPHKSQSQKEAETSKIIHAPCSCSSGSISRDDGPF